MSLAFNSLSHGQIAFGFFNAETDLLILDTYFLFASDLCREIAEVARDVPSGPIKREWPVYILKEEDIGNLSAVIHRRGSTGFIGDVYRIFPLPADIHVLAQDPEGEKTREAVTKTIERYCPGPSNVLFTAGAEGSTVEIGDYMFSAGEFRDLLRCVWVGDYPNWKNGVRPRYVSAMVESITGSGHPLFKGMSPFV